MVICHYMDKLSRDGQSWEGNILPPSEVMNWPSMCVLPMRSPKKAREAKKRGGEEKTG